MKRYGQKGGHASLWFEKGMMETTTLTLMGLFANFAISYAANNVSTLRDLINRKKRPSLKEVDTFVEVKLTVIV